MTAEEQLELDRELADPLAPARGFLVGLGVVSLGFWGPLAYAFVRSFS